MPRAKAIKPEQFAEYVASVAAKADRSELSTTLGKLVAKRLEKQSIAAVAAQLRRYPSSFSGDTAGTLAAMDASTSYGDLAKRKRRSARRIGRAKAYTPTNRTDVSRIGTFRHYMIATIRRHNNTADAEREHATCDNPKFAKNRLDFNWAADNGFINWA